MKKIVEWFGGSVVKDIMGGLDKLFTSKEEKILAENAIKQILIQKELELQKMQTEIIVAEAKANINIGRQPPNLSLIHISEPTRPY